MKQLIKQVTQIKKKKKEKEFSPFNYQDFEWNDLKEFTN